MRPNHCINVAIALLGLAPLLAKGESLATQPAAQPSTVSAPAPREPGKGNTPTTSPSATPQGNNSSTLDDTQPHRTGRFGQRFFTTVTTKEMDDAMKFMKAHSPNRYEAISNLPENDRKRNITELAARNYVNWMRMQAEDNELYLVVVTRFELEDQIFGLVSQLQKDPNQTKRDIREKLRNQVTSLVDLGIKERQIRLDRLAKTVQQQQQKLTEDAANRQALVDDRLKTILKEEKGLLPGGGGGNNPGAAPRNHGPGHAASENNQ